MHIRLEGMTEAVVDPHDVQDQDPDLVQDSVQRDGNRCYKWREYDHFANDCLNSEAGE